MRFLGSIPPTLKVSRPRPIPNGKGAFIQSRVRRITLDLDGCSLSPSSINVNGTGGGFSPSAPRPGSCVVIAPCSAEVDRFEGPSAPLGLRRDLESAPLPSSLWASYRRRRTRGARRSLSLALRPFRKRRGAHQQQDGDRYRDDSLRAQAVNKRLNEGCEQEQDQHPIDKP